MTRTLHQRLGLPASAAPDEILAAVHPDFARVHAKRVALSAERVSVAEERIAVIDVMPRGRAKELPPVVASQPSGPSAAVAAMLEDLGDLDLVPRGPGWVPPSEPAHADSHDAMEERLRELTDRLKAIDEALALLDGPAARRVRHEARAALWREVETEYRSGAAGIARHLAAAAEEARAWSDLCASVIACGAVPPDNIVAPRYRVTLASGCSELSRILGATASAGRASPLASIRAALAE